MVWVIGNTFEIACNEGGIPGSEGSKLFASLELRGFEAGLRAGAFARGRVAFLAEEDGLIFLAFALIAAGFFFWPAMTGGEEIPRNKQKKVTHRQLRI